MDEKEQRFLNGALFSVIEEGKIKEVSDLLADGAQINARSEAEISLGQTPLELAKSKNNPEIIEILEKHQQKLDQSLLSVSENNDVDEAERLLDLGANPDACDEHGETVLKIACEENNKDLAELLIRKGADVNAVNNHGESVFMEAIKSGSREIIKLLLSNGANVNVEDAQCIAKIFEKDSSQKGNSKSSGKHEVKYKRNPNETPFMGEQFFQSRGVQDFSGGYPRY